VSFYKQYFTIIGLLALTVVVSILLLPPSMILARQVTFIDIEPYRATAEQTPVRTKFDLGSVEHVRGLPMEIGKWRGTDYDTSEIEEALNADVILMRAYQSPGFYQPIFLLIMQSNDPWSFHPAVICYPALGYQIEEHRKEKIPLSNVDWVSYWRSEKEQNIASINTNRLLIFKESDGKVTERRVVLYFFVSERLAPEEKITMVRVSTLVPIDLSYDGVLSLTKDFMAEVVPLLFEFCEREEMIAVHLAETGPGWLLMAVLVIIPLAVIIHPVWRRK